MLNSMTGYGRSEKQNGIFACKAEVRSVNNQGRVSEHQQWIGASGVVGVVRDTDRVIGLRCRDQADRITARADGGQVIAVGGSGGKGQGGFQVGFADRSAEGLAEDKVQLGGWVLHEGIQAAHLDR